MDLSVVIISWRMKSMLEDMLNSIKEYTKGITYELIVVDNNSQDGTSEMVRRAFPEAILIVNQENCGVAPSRNQAFPIAKGRYVITLDADMLLVENSLKKMVEFMDATPKAGLCGAKLIFPDGKVQPSGRRFPTPLAFILRRLSFLPWAQSSKILKHHEMAEWARSDVRDVDYVIGACQLIRREAMQQVGFLDDKIFYGPEDIDYCIRMHKSGWNVLFFPYTSIIHYEQRITKKRLFSKLSWLHLQGIIYLFVKHGGRFYPKS